MAHLLGPTPTLILALCLLVIVGSLPALPSLSGIRARLAPLLAVGAITATAALVWLALERPGTMLDEFPGRIVKYAAGELNASKEPTVLVIDGGSYVINGVDCNDLMKELGKLGHEVRAIRVAAGAANHFERFRMQQRVVERLQPRRPKQRWVLLAEVQIGYDRAPLSQFTENPDTDRAYEYSTLGNGWNAVAASRSPNVSVPEGWRWPMLQSTLINSFSVGAFLRLSDETTIEAGGGRVASRRGSFKVRDQLKNQVADLRAPPQGDTYPWLMTIREPRLSRLWQPFQVDFAYFGVPSTSAEHLAYVRNFCATTKRSCVSPADAQLLTDLDGPEYWRDRNHMNKKGATIYTRWLAHELVRLKIVR